MKQGNTLRDKILKVSYKAGSCHIGSALSCVEILEALKGKEPFIFSKASGICAWYCMNYSTKKAIELMKKYPLPSKEGGLLWSGGSLGMGLSVACGIALSGVNTHVLISDGELQEGQTWEALMFAAHHHLPLKVVVDRNWLQALGSTEDICSLGRLEDKLWAFGWNVKTVDGHNVKEIKKALIGETPLIVIAETVKGKGVDFMENNNDWHYMNLNEERYKKAIFQLNT
jgi:transketolase